ncbi:MAG TPA: motility protein A [Candidatus Hydrogenedentes bacterium]|jgi:chemotaxis protein MotA|nr:motility protein A [Candidatus Hydrogenedentota bacterium]HPJ98115.1 motility protein A [Candidatus Hydrogenedentota bacterium]
MDIATLVGLISGVTLVVVSILMGGNPGVFWSSSSVVIVMGGTLAATLINFPLGDVLSVMNTVKNAFFHKDVPPESLIPRLVSFATIARREGILALESHASEAEDEFLEKSVQLAIDGTAPELIKDILTTELAFMEDRHAMGQSILVAMGTYAPAFGMIGTLIGLVQMLATLDDPSKIGEGMAVALLTTLYGALLANMVFLPGAGKLKVRTSNELLAKELVIEGILSIQSGDNPRVVEQKLKAFVSPAVRRQVSAV